MELAIITEYLLLLVSELGLELIDKHRALGQKATGAWEESVEARGQGYSASLWANHYTEWLAQGRGPNQDQSPEALRRWAVWAGINIIDPWAKAKGITLDSPIAVAYKIAREGTKSHPEGTDLIDGVITPERVQEMMESLGQFVSLEIAKVVRRDLQRAFA